MERENRERGIREEGATLCSVQLATAAPRLAITVAGARVAPLCLCRAFITVEAALSRHHRCASTEPVTPLLLRCHTCREGEEMREEGSSVASDLCYRRVAATEGPPPLFSSPPCFMFIVGYSAVAVLFCFSLLPIITVFVRYCCPYPEPPMSLLLLPQKN
ncbi:uncharacterized protein DS421_9g269560 [Arachis hypogaea]|nr:uncharacterized protein DS421_9g269560 [Arachis hypogaea]